MEMLNIQENERQYEVLINAKKNHQARTLFLLQSLNFWQDTDLYLNYEKVRWEQGFESFSIQTFVKILAQLQWKSVPKQDLPANFLT